MNLTVLAVATGVAVAPMLAVGRVVHSRVRGDVRDNADPRPDRLYPALAHALNDVIEEDA